MTDHTTENDAKVCDVCGSIATTTDGICQAYLCDNTECFDTAWDRAFPPDKT